jgi:hypothetical protein
VFVIELHDFIVFSVVQIFMDFERIGFFFFFFFVRVLFWVRLD